MKVERALLASKNIDENKNWIIKTSSLRRTYVREVLKIKAESFVNKPLHGYVRKKS